MFRKVNVLSICRWCCCGVSGNARGSGGGQRSRFSPHALPGPKPTNLPTNNVSKSSSFVCVVAWGRRRVSWALLLVRFYMRNYFIRQRAIMVAGGRLRGRNVLPLRLTTVRIYCRWICKCINWNEIFFWGWMFQSGNNRSVSSAAGYFFIAINGRTPNTLIMLKLINFKI